MSSPSNRRRLTGGTDHISNLPDAILCQILSHLSTRCTLMTSVLSKRWKYLWTKVPALDFTDRPNNQIGFLSLVDKVLLHNDVSCVQRLCFGIEKGDDDFLVNSWLNVASRRQVCELNLKIAQRLRRQLVLFPPKFLTCERLEVLNLNGPIGVDAPVTFCLTNLMTVRLYRIRFPDDGFIKKLVLSSPKLQELSIVGCFGIVSTLYLQSPNLKSLTICNTLEPCAASRPCLVIKAPKLQLLHLQEDMIKYDICDLRFLVKATIRVEYGFPDSQTLELLRKLSEVQTLDLTRAEVTLPSIGLSSSMQYIPSKPYVLHSLVLLQAFRFRSGLPIFRNLILLELREADEHIFNLLSCVPRLRKLIIESVYLRSPYNAKHAPKCLPQLRIVEFRSFSGEEEEFSLLSYFLKAAFSLKELQIYIEFTEVDEERSFYKNLLLLPRSSPRCQIDIVDLVNN